MILSFSFSHLKQVVNNETNNDTKDTDKEKARIKRCDYVLLCMCACSSTERKRAYFPLPFDLTFHTSHLHTLMRDITHFRLISIVREANSTQESIFGHFCSVIEEFDARKTLVKKEGCPQNCSMSASVIVEGAYSQSRSGRTINRAF